jgi:hypothetical protein
MSLSLCLSVSLSLCLSVALHVAAHLFTCGAHIKKEKLTHKLQKNKMERAGACARREREREEAGERKRDRENERGESKKAALTSQMFLS